MGKGILKKKRTRLVALLAALCAFLAVGIGAGAAAASRAATKKSAEASSSLAARRKVRAGSAADGAGSKDAAFWTEVSDAHSHYTNDGGVNPVSNFNTSAQMFNLASIYGLTGWAGKEADASITLQPGTYMPITLGVGLFNPDADTFQNPNSMNPEQIEAAMLNGDYVGAIVVGIFGKGHTEPSYSFLGEVTYDGGLISAMPTYLASSNGQNFLNAIGVTGGEDGFDLEPESVQYIFQQACNGSELLSNQYFAQMAALPTEELQDTLHSLLLGPEGLYTLDEAYYGQSAPAGSQVATDLSNLKAESDGLDSPSTVQAFKDAFQAYQDALSNGEDASAARVAYLSSFSGTTGYTSATAGESMAQRVPKYQPLLCLAAWNQNVNYTSFPTDEVLYEQGSDTSGFGADAFSKAYGSPNEAPSAFDYPPSSSSGYQYGSAETNAYPYAYWGWGPCYAGMDLDPTKAVPDPSNTLSMAVSPMATDFLAYVFKSRQNLTDPAITLMADYATDQSAGSYSASGAGDTASVQLYTLEKVGGKTKKVKYGTPENVSIGMQSIGLTPTQVNPTALPEVESQGKRVQARLSTSSPSSYGLYFYAASQSGEPLKSVKMELVPLNGAPGYPFYGAWNYYNDGQNQTPIAPAVDSTPFGVTKKGNSYRASYGTYWAGYFDPVSFTAQSLASQPGWFDFSGVGLGTYAVTILGGTTEDGAQINYPSSAVDPTFQINASNYSGSETVSAITDPCGFVLPSEDAVIVADTSSGFTGAQPPANKQEPASSSNPYTATVGSSNLLAYQVTGYAPWLTLTGPTAILPTSGAQKQPASSNPLPSFTATAQPGEEFEDGTIEINGVPLSTLEADDGVSLTAGASSFTLGFTEEGLHSLLDSGEGSALCGTSLSSAQLPKWCASQGVLASTASTRPLPEAGTLVIKWKAYLNTSFQKPSSSGYEFSYGAYDGQTASVSGSFAPVSTNGPAGQDYSKVSLDPASSPSSETGLWFKDLQADGQQSTGAKFEVQNSSGQYLNGDPSNFSGWTWSSTPQQFSASSLGTGTFAFGGLADGTYFVTLTQWPEEMMKGTEGNGANTGKNNWASAPYPMGVATGSAATDSFQVVLSYSSPEDTTSINDPAGLVDHSSDSMYSLAPVKMAPVNGSSLSSQAYQTETVGVPFTEGWEGYLPFDSVNPYSSTLSSGIQVAFPEGDGGLDNGGNSSGLQMHSPAASNVEVAGIPLSQLISKGGLPSSDVTSSGGIYTIEIPGSVLSYIENNGKNEAGEPLSSSSNRLVIISFPALMTTSFKEGGQFQQWMALGADDGWWIQNPGGAWGVYSSHLYTNGSASKPAPSVSDFSHSTSGQTGIWFKSLWWGSGAAAQGAKFTVSQIQGGKTVYLTPVENDKGDFTGWSWKSSPYDFTEQNSDADFSMGGLADGTYTVTEVDPATGATPSSLTFTSSLSYSSREALSDVKDSLHLLSASQGVVYNMVVPSSLPLTGGSWVLIISSAAVLLFAAGAVMFMVRKKRRA